MLRQNEFKQKLKAGQPTFGLFCSVPHPLMVELIALADYDFVILDTEHVLVNPETLENMIRAAEALSITPLVRLGDGSKETILRALDAGALGVVVPHVESGAQAEAIVRAARYYPEGMRSLNGGRPGAFGKRSLVEYMKRANEEILVIPMIESQAGLEHLDEILAVPGIDLILEGSADLSQSFGIPWQTGSQTVQDALAHLHARCCEIGVPSCAIPRTAAEFAPLWQRGIRSFVLGDERGISFRALNAHRTSYHQLIPTKETVPDE